MKAQNKKFGTTKTYISRIENDASDIEEKSPYDPEFVKKILQGKEDIKNGKGVKIAIEDLWK